MFKIYTLADPITGNIRYIGKTSNTLQYRLAQHLRESNKITTRKANWIRSIKKQSINPVIELLDEYDNEKLCCYMECFWIEQFKAWGFDLTNYTKGGEGVCGLKHSTESKTKMSKSKKALILKMSNEERIKKFSHTPRVPILQYDSFGILIKEWESIKSIWKTYPTFCCNVIDNIKRRSLGFFWFRKTENVYPTKIEITIPKKFSKNVTFINKLSLEEYTYPSIREGSRCLNISMSHINSYLYKNVPLNNYEIKYL